MPITATFQADFTAFSTAVVAAETKLVSFEGNAKKVANSLSAMEKSISGVSIMQAATIAAEGVERLGGVTKLTYAELQRLGSTAQEAVDKMKALGQNVPTNIQNIADRARGASEEMLRLGDSTAKAAEGGGLLKNALGGIAGQLAGMFTVGALVAFGKEVLEVGGQIKKMADQTGLTTEQVQRLNYVAGQSGTSMSAIISAVQTLQERLGDESSGAAGALKRLGISLDDLKQQTGYEQLLTIADAIRAIKDPTEQAAKAADVFGKSWKEILPAIKSGMGDVAAQAPVMADETIKSLDRVGSALNRAKAQSITWGGAFVLALEQSGFALGDFLSKFNPEHFGVANSMLLEMEGHLNDPDGIRGALAKIPPIALDVAGAFKNMALSAEDVKRIEGELDAQLKTSIETNRQVAAEREKAAKEYADLLKEVAKIEKDTRGQQEAGVLGLSKLKQDESQKEFEALGRASTEVLRMEAAERDFIAKSTMDSTSYQISKVNEAAQAKIAAFKGTSDQVAQYSQLVMNQAAREADAIIAASSRALNSVAEQAVGAARAVQMAIQQIQAGQAVDVVANAQAVGGRASGMQAPIYVAPPIFARAAGGPVSAGQPYLVGEQGPELFVPSASGGILPNGRSGGMVVNINVTQPLGTPTQIAAVVGKALMQTLRQQGTRMPSGV